MISFTGGGGFAPTTPQGKFLVTCWTFAVLLLTSAYTANLASLLVVEGRQVSSIKDMADAVRRSVPICVPQGSAAENIVRKRYPTAILQDFGLDDFIEDGWTNAHCAAMVVNSQKWESIARQSKYNPGCKMGTIGSLPLAPRMDSSFVSLSSLAQARFGEQCTHRMVAVIDAILQQFYEDDLLSQTLEDEVGPLEDQACGADDVDESGSLSISATGGIFLLYTFTLICVIAWQGFTGKSAP
eukprot:CAMPEP_0180575102 /NCGR_PEP_ID=MMETSP1037_2-20121125/10705_1 /TAXON_ID=632150 /ORGANISM="Azadinium spinosum, Strain 3D9" /LENGTH=240 /DNA_ID=CAMNT_0022592727 /DNA_START=53 /DNA_END=772 /DNA_ORIENTATION=-